MIYHGFLVHIVMCFCYFDGTSSINLCLLYDLIMFIMYLQSQPQQIKLTTDVSSLCKHLPLPLPFQSSTVCFVSFILSLVCVCLYLDFCVYIDYASQNGMLQLCIVTMATTFQLFNAFRRYVYVFLFFCLCLKLGFCCHEVGLFHLLKAFIQCEVHKTSFTFKK